MIIFMRAMLRLLSYIPMIASLEVVDEYGEVVTDLCHPFMFQS